MLAVGMIAAGLVLAVVGVVVLFGWPWAALACGVVLIVVGLVADLEALNGKHSQPPPR